VATLSAVKKVSKAILIAFASLVTLAVLGLLGINLYIQSPHTQTRIQDELSKALQLPLKITNTSLTPWSDLRIHGITVPGEGGNFLEAESFHAHYRFLPLFRGRLEVTEMVVENPKIHWVQNAEGKWKLPALEKVPSKTTEPAKLKSTDKSRINFEVAVARFLVKNGSVVMTDHAGQALGVFTDVTLDYAVLTADRVEGVASIGHAAWGDAVALESVRAPFEYTPGPSGEIALPDLTATFAGGKVHGEYRAWPESAKSPFEVSLNFDDVSLDQLAMQEGWKPGQAAGFLGGEITLSGESSRLERAEGRGKLRLRDGQLRQLELLQTIGQVLGIRELSDFHLQDAHADFHVSGERVHVEQLTLASPDLQLTSKGTIRFDQRVSLEAQLSVEDAIVKRLPQLVSEGFGTADNGRRTLDFNIGGTTSKLKTNLMDKLIVHKIDAQFGGLLDGLFKRKDDDKKKKDEEKEKRKKEKEKEKEAQKNAATPAPLVVPAPPAPPTPDAAPKPSLAPPPPASESAKPQAPASTPLAPAPASPPPAPAEPTPVPASPAPVPPPSTPPATPPAAAPEPTPAAGEAPKP